MRSSVIKLDHTHTHVVQHFSTCELLVALIWVHMFATNSLYRPDKQQLATDFAGSPRTVSPDKQWCKLISVRRTEFHPARIVFIPARIVLIVRWAHYNEIRQQCLTKTSRKSRNRYMGCAAKKVYARTSRPSARPRAPALRTLASSSPCLSIEEHGEEDARVRRAGTRGQSWLLILKVLLTSSKLMSVRRTEFHVPHGQKINLNLHFICAHGHDHNDLHRQSLQNVFQALFRAKLGTMMLQMWHVCSF